MKLLSFIWPLVLMLALNRPAIGKTLPTENSTPVLFNNIFNQAKYANLHTASSEFYLSEDEKLVVALCNLARFDGHAFIREILLPAGIDTSNLDFQGMLSKLKSTRNLPPLMPAYSLHKTALSHAKDMGLSGDSGHISSKGLNFEQRISQYFPNHAGFAENFHLGSGEPLDIVLSFLSNKHNSGIYRDNILSANLHYIGVSIQPHRNSCSDAVIDFARKPKILPATSASTSKRKKTEAYFMDCPKGHSFDSPGKKQGFSLFKLFSRRN